MARFYDSTYDPRKDSGTSGAELSDRNPEQSYDVDLRRVEMDTRENIDGSNDQQGRIKKFFNAARASGKYKQQRGFSEPSIGGRTPVGKADLQGTVLPSLRGENFFDVGAGSTQYAKKPQPQFGKAFYL